MINPNMCNYDNIISTINYIHIYTQIRIIITIIIIIIIIIHK